MSARPITEDDLNGFIDGALDDARRVEVAAYLDAHPDVARRVAGYCDQRDQLRAALAPIAEEPVPPELDVARMVEGRRHPRTARWPMAAAAAVLFCVGGIAGWWLRGPGPAAGVEALAQEAAASYAAYVPDMLRPVEIRADDRAQLAAWTAQRLGRPVGIPDLAASGYRFMGGRVVPTGHGPAALFMYDDDHGTRLVVLVRPMASGRTTPMAPHDAGGVSGLAWADGGLGCSLVGPMAADRLHPLADDVRRQLRGSI